MNWNRAFRLQSFAQLFSILTFAIVFANFQLAYADDCSVLLRKCKETDDGKKSVTELKACQDAKSSCGGSSGGSGGGTSGGSDCDYLKRRADDKKDEFYRTCKSSGQGAATCKAQKDACDDAGGDEEYGNSAELLVAFSRAMNVPQDQIGSKCSQYSGQGFYEEKDRIEDKLKEISKSLKDNKKELADINKDFTADLKKIQDDIADAQKEYQKSQTDTKKGQRDRAAEQAKQAGEMAQNMRKLESAVLQKQQEKDSIYADKASSLAQMTEDVANSTCMDSVREAYQKRKEMQKQTNQSGNMKSLVGKGTTSNNFINMTFKQCMSKFYNARLTLIRTSDAKIETADKDIRNAQSDLDDMKTQLSQMSNLEAQAKQDEQTSLTAEQTALQQKIQRASTEMQSLQQSTQQKAKAVTDDTAELEKNYKQLSNELINLGAAPKGGRKGTTSGTEVSAAANDYTDARDSAQRAGCNYDDTVFGTRGGSKSTGSNSKSSNSSRSTGGSK